MSMFYNTAYTFKSIGALTRTMIANDMVEQDLPLPKPTFRRQVQISSKLETPLVIENDHVIVIRNNHTILSLISNYRKQNSVQICIVGEPDFVSLIAKNSGEYPMILLRIPIDDKNCYVKRPSSCYEFPIDSIASRIGNDTKGITYTIEYKKTSNKDISFSLKVYGSNSEKPSMDIFIKEITTFGQNHISSLLRDDITAALISETSDVSMMSFLQMEVIMLKKNTDTSENFIVAKNGNSEAQFVIDDGKFQFILADSRKQESKIIAVKDESDTYVWEFPETKTVYRLKEFASLFKSGFSKPTHEMGQIYYVFTKFGKQYLFVKVITSLVVDGAALKHNSMITKSSNIIAFGNIFKSNVQVIECYACNVQNMKSDFY